ncbi:MAG: insulinase family protein [Bacteroidales bacterium]|nr:insulinase family protein [Bacteroidales bacterium]
MKRFTTFVLALAAVICANAWRHDFKTVEGDPMNSLLYTLPNGMKVYMTVNKEKPRIQTYIAVRVGGKNDPAETTGLAHYFEHLMFKGTKQFGTSDYAAEEPMLDRIEQLFETYRHTTDSTERARIYHEIDSVSYAASLIAIPNEYDKLMSTIGASGSNAYTSYDVTCYVEDIPSNQIDNWALIQADRFRNPVLRGFHTELETIYEEKNMSLTSDNSKSIEALLNMLYPAHPYGTQTVLGTQENLKNPSITNVKNYHKEWYVPNNIAVCASGDFDPDEFVDTIEKYFGDMVPNPSLKHISMQQQPAIDKPLSRTVKGPDAETVFMGWRIPAAAHEDMLALNVLSEVLDNGQCGLFDINIAIPQRVLTASAFPYSMADGGMLIAYGRPNEGQTLAEVRDIILEQITRLRQGEFSDELVTAAVNNLKKHVQRQLESNSDRADLFVNSFVNGEDWEETVAQLSKIDKITKADIVALANKYFGPDNYATVFKEQGKDDTELKLSKPQITPIATNRDKKSDFLARIQSTKVEPIEPRFVDFKQDMTTGTAKDGKIEVLYTKNTINKLFTLTFVYDLGNARQRALALASEYIDLIGNPDMSAAQIKTEFYRLACSYRFSIGLNRSYVVISGLSENMDKALALYEKLVAEAVPDAEVWAACADRLGKAYTDSKSNQRINFSRLSNYARYGNKENNPVLQTGFTPTQLKGLNPKEITDAVKELSQYKHRIIYYGPEDIDNVIAHIDSVHKIPAEMKDTPAERIFPDAITDETIIYVAPYDAKQLYMAMLSNRGDTFDAGKDAMRHIYNEYFGAGMNTIVFQEMRESRSLAYSASAYMQKPSKKDRPYIYTTMIATQNDKLGDAIDAFLEIINDMPRSESAFILAKEGLDSRMRTERADKDAIPWLYINAQDLGVDSVQDKVLFDAVKTATLDDVVKYQQENVKGRKFVYAILGDIEDLDMDKLNSIGRVVKLTTEDIFGF